MDYLCPEAKPALVLADDVVIQEIDDVVVVYQLGPGHAYRLNHTAGLILKSIAMALTPEEVAERVASEYDVSKEQASADVQEFVAQLVALGLVRTVQ